MSGAELDDDVRTLLETRLDSFEKLEIVQALRASGPGMTREALEAACRFSSEMVREVLASLERTELIEQDPARGGLVRLGAGSKDPRFEPLMELYRADRFQILSALSSLAMERIRHLAAQAFADAFMIKKKRDDDR